MIRNVRFWIAAVLFQAAFGLAVFAITRQYYMHDPAPVASGTVRAAPQPDAWPDLGADSDLDSLMSEMPSDPPPVTDPEAISRLADEYFGNGQYEEAAVLYAKVLASGSKNVNTYNSLGLTLHYLGRSTEALQKLNEGIAVDPGYQRIWLTLGFVNSQMGNIEEARKALTKAVQLGADNEVGQSAQEMLQSLQ